MTLGPAQLALYAGGLLALFLTPGPVWVALAARTLAGGFSAAWPLAIGVAIGDLLWPVLAIFGVTWILSVYGGFLEILRWVAVVLFAVMGAQLIRKPAVLTEGSDSRLTRPGRRAGFIAGVAVILANPKAILFYMGMLPGFFDLDALTGPDIVLIACISFTIPLFGNLVVATFVDRARRLLSSPAAVRRTNRIAGGMLLAVALAIAFG
ncbi:LysE family translocator [Roseicyclus sp. F158]|uniref:LysE family translocator n=1 Tax=Tropicimonas omnivorans TaxID=3075590 RepID=A0ABU3DDB8_9RHOB|nr:LysE family translocator [Roseicyclus sp. F158]MDT0681711.1 LysE family translocator [Roseicyclus sp. F158]